jgi:hypothetical protein
VAPNAANSATRRRRDIRPWSSVSEERDRLVLGDASDSGTLVVMR